MIANKLNSCLRRQGITLTDLFSDVDVSSSGIIPLNLFLQGLSSINFYYSQDELESLIHDFCNSNFINYAALSKYLRNIQNEKKINVKPEIDPIYLVKLGSTLASQGLTLSDIFIEYDRSRIGKISYRTFLRNLGTYSFSKTIADAYISPEGEIDYNQLQLDVNNAIKEASLPKFNENIELPSFFPSFARVISSKRINLLDEFNAFDRTRKGRINLSQFLSILSSFNLPFSPMQISNIANSFIHDNFVDYLSFIKKIKEVNDKIQKEINEPQKTSSTLSNDFDQILISLKKQMMQRHITIRDLFNHLEMTSHEIPINHFFRYLSKEGFQFSRHEMEEIESHFAISGKSQYIDVRAFIDWASPAPANVEDDGGKSGLIRLNNFLISHRIWLLPLLLKYDLEDSGKISTHQFYSTLKTINFDISSLEMTQFIRKYQCKTNSVYFDYKAFCRDVDPPPPPKPVYKPQRSITTNSSYSDTIEKSLTQFKSIEDAYSISLLDEFKKQDFDHHDEITIEGFKEVLHSFHIKTETNNMHILIQFYSTISGGIAYLDLCKDINENAQKNQNELSQANPQENVPNQEIQSLKSIIRILKGILIAQRENIDDYFLTVDKFHSGLVLMEKVRPLLGNVFEFLQEEQICLLLESFRDLRQPEKFNYRFLSIAISDSPGPNEEERARINEMFDIRSGRKNEIFLLINTIMNKLSARHKKVHNLFSCNDCPYISQTDFMKIFDSIGIVIEDNEYEKLFMRYKGPNYSVDWSKFCNDIERSRENFMQ